jgi:hypothetical protein
MEILAARVAQGRQQPPGIAFARSQLTAPHERPKKEEARGDILRRLSLRHWPWPLSIVTLPGLTWGFERRLLRMRERPVTLVPKDKTRIVSLESQPEVFASALALIPRGPSGIRHLSDLLPGAVSTACTDKIDEFICTAFEDFAHEWKDEADVAWLDFTGKVTRSLLHALAQFWPKVRGTLILTAMRRGAREVSPLVRKQGDLVQAIRSVLPGSVVGPTLNYCDTAPMMQACFHRSRTTRRTWQVGWSARSRAQPSPMTAEIARIAWEIRDQKRNTPGFRSVRNGLRYTREVLRRDGLGDFSEAMIDRAVRNLAPVTLDFAKQKEAFDEGFRRDHPDTPALSQLDWHKQMRAAIVGGVLPSKPAGVSS